MTDFIHNPYKTVYVRDMIKMSLDDLLNMMSTLESGNAYWAEGVLCELCHDRLWRIGKKRDDWGNISRQNYFFKIWKIYQNGKIFYQHWNQRIKCAKKPLYRDLISWIKTQPIWNEWEDSFSNLKQRFLTKNEIIVIFS